MGSDLRDNFSKCLKNLCLQSSLPCRIFGLSKLHYVYPHELVMFREEIDHL